jgi:hypothetical protein
MKLSSTISLSASALLFVALVGGPTSTAQAQGRRISLPPQASEIAQGIYDLGLARDVDGTVVQGFAFVHYKKDFVKPEKPGGTKPPKASSCYAFMASGAKWKGDPEPFIFDQTVPNAAARLALVETAIATWESTAGKDILGDGIVAAVSLPEVATTLNGFNEVTFGSFEDPYVIAMTTVWGIWGGPPAGRQLVEWDMVFSNANWAWWYGEGDEPTTFTDFLSIATHEIGHAMGMDHPNDTCTEETMYAYSGWSETKKRDLNAGDIAGIRKLYP